MTVPSGTFGTTQSKYAAFTGISLCLDGENIVRERTKLWQSCTRSIQRLLYDRTIITRSMAMLGQIPQLQPACCKNEERFGAAQGVAQ